jgi:hypothetical protein
MTSFSRRAALIGSASLAALSMGMAVSQESTPPGSDSQDPRRVREPLSFSKARATVQEVVTGRVIPASEKEFGVVYTQADVARINAHIWDRTHAILRQHYTLIE